MFYLKLLWVFLAFLSLSQITNAGIALNTEGKLQRYHAPPTATPARHKAMRPRDRNSLITEGARLSNDFWDFFWDPDFQHFRTLKKTSETVGDWNGETLWPYIIGVEALLEAEAVRPGQFADEITTALADPGVGKFFSSDYNAYTAWVYTPGNTDIYYDDNAQVVIALLRAYELSTTSNAAYLSRAQKVTDFLLTGWDTANGGGMKWHVAMTTRNACTTSLTAVAVLTLAKMGHGTDGQTSSQLITFGRTAIQWILDQLQLDSGLIMDGVGGGPTYTYNTGITLHAICLLQDVSPSSDLDAKAQRLAEAALDRTKSLFDTTVANTAYRYWWDNTFFLHLLFEGLTEYIRVFGNSHPSTVANIKMELTRHTDYMQKYLKDDDGLYWRSLRLYTISATELAAYKNLTGDTTRQPDFNQEERLMDDASMALPIGNRGMAKTLLGSGGAARCLLIAARVA